MNLTNQQRRQQHHQQSLAMREAMFLNPRPDGSYNHLRSSKRPPAHSPAPLVLLDATEKPRPAHQPRSSSLDISSTQVHPGFGHRLDTGFAMMHDEDFES